MIGPNASIIGTLQFTICNDRIELEKCHGFENSIAPLERCLHGVNLKEEYPVAFLRYIGIQLEFRRNQELAKNHKYGSTLLRKFEEIVTDCGCKMAVCRVAWPESTRQESISFYNHCDWKLFAPSPKELVMAFKPLNVKAPKELNYQTKAKMIVYWQDENFGDPIAPKPVSTTPA